MHALQLWVALPREHEDTEPSFAHHPADSLPEITKGNVRLRILAGAAFGATSPVAVHSPLFYVEALLAPGATLTIPPDYEERAVYVVSGAARSGGLELSPRQLAVLAPGSSVDVHSSQPTTLMLLGGSKLDGPRFIWWNFVSSTKEGIVEAARQWKMGAFPRVPGDTELVPLDADPPF
jgi:redox-sensitive bicupin YhaK (pirin superfamily)